MPRLKKKSYFQKCAADRLKVRKKREDEKYRMKEQQRSNELRQTRQEIKVIKKKENEKTNQEKDVRLTDSSPTRPFKEKEQLEGTNKKLVSGNQVSGLKPRKKTVKFTFDELLDYIRLSRVKKPKQEKVAPEEVVVPVDVLIKQEVDIREGSVDNTKEDESITEEVPTVFIKQEIKQEEDAEEIAALHCSPVAYGGKGLAGESLKLQMEAKLIALNAHGGLGCNPRGRYECLYCGERLLTRNCLNLHMRSHGSVADSFECDTCGKKLSSPQTLVHHKRLHTGVFPLHCGACGRGFSVRETLAAHIRTHTGERPYRCERCSKAYTHRGALINHVRIHHAAGAKNLMQRHLQGTRKFTQRKNIC